jgi:hypothetical protein
MTVRIPVQPIQHTIRLNKPRQLRIIIPRIIVKQPSLPIILLPGILIPGSLRIIAGAYCAEGFVADVSGVGAVCIEAACGYSFSFYQILLRTASILSQTESVILFFQTPPSNSLKLLSFLANSSTLSII